MIPGAISGPASRLGAAAQNAFEVARFGGLETGEEPSPFEVVTERRVFRLRRYFADAAAGPPIVLVPPMMLAADVYDVSPASSAVSVLHELGVDPWVVDFGSPEHEEGGLERNLDDHVVAVSDAVDEVRERTGRDVHLGGYSQGGMFCYQTAAFRRGGRDRLGDHLRQPGRYPGHPAPRNARGGGAARAAGALAGCSARAACRRG